MILALRRDWTEAGRHLKEHKVNEARREEQGRRKIILPEDPERLLTASCKFKKCKQVFVGLKGETEIPN